MIRNTFCILEGIGEKLEKRLWKEGILTWEEFTDAKQLFGFSSERKRSFDDSLIRNKAELDAGNAAYFSKKLKRREHWRLYHSFKKDAVCLDIENERVPAKRRGLRYGCGSLRRI